MAPKAEPTTALILLVHSFILSDPNTKPWGSTSGRDGTKYYGTIKKNVFRMVLAGNRCRYKHPGLRPNFFRQLLQYDKMCMYLYCVVTAGQAKSLPGRKISFLVDIKESTLSGRRNKNWPAESVVKMKSAVNVSLPVMWFIWEICSRWDKLPIGSTLGIWETGLYLQEEWTYRSQCNPFHETLCWNLCYQWQGSTI